MKFLLGKFRIFSKRELAQAYHDVFNSDSGRLVLHDLLKAGHFFRACYDPKNTHNTAFMNGERNMVLRIKGFLNLTEEEVEKLAHEAKYYQTGDIENEH